MPDSHTPSREEILIRSIIDAEFAYKSKHHGDVSTPPVVAMYREYGAGGDHIARYLAKKLDTRIYDQEILDIVAKAAKVDRHLMEELDDKVHQDKSNWVRGLFTTNTAFPASYRRHLIDVILEIAHSGGIIMGRGAHYILADRDAFRIRVYGSEERCAERIAEREAMSREGAQAKVAAINKERSTFLWKMFHVRHNDPSTFDLMINTDKLEDYGAIADMIVRAMASMGFDVPDEGAKELSDATD